jgi:hypothetical protein
LAVCPAIIDSDSASTAGKDSSRLTIINNPLARKLAPLEIVSRVYLMLEP